MTSQRSPSLLAVAVDWSLSIGRSRLVALDWSLSIGRPRLVALDWSLSPKRWEPPAQPRLPFLVPSSPESRSIPIMLRLVRPFDRHPDVVGLLLRERRESRAELAEMQARHLFIQ